MLVNSFLRVFKIFEKNVRHARNSYTRVHFVRESFSERYSASCPIIYYLRVLNSKLKHDFTGSRVYGAETSTINVAL